jgi:tRNA1(Val) A37 N6-methylase TrmN6
MAKPDTLAAWIEAANRLLRPQGTLTLIWRAEGLDHVLASLALAFGGVTILPIYPAKERPAIRIMAQASKGSRARLSLLPGFILSDAQERPTPQAEAVLRRGEALISQPDDGNSPARNTTSR